MKAKAIFVSAFVLVTTLAQANSISEPKEIARGAFSTNLTNVQVRGSAKIVREEYKDRLILSSDFEVTEGPELDVQVCGVTSDDPYENDLTCTSLGPLRSLSGAQEYEINYQMFSYVKVRVFNMGELKGHAFASMNSSLE